MKWKLPILALMALLLRAECRLPDIAPDAVAHLSPSQLLDSGHYLRAEQILQPLSEANPKDGRVAWMLSRAKAALGKLEEAMLLAESAAAADPSNPAYHVQLAAVSGRLAEKASLLKRLTYARRAKQELDAAAALDPRNTEAQWGFMMFYYAAPSLLGGDKAKAQQIGRQLAINFPDVGAYYEGRLATEMQEPEKAELFYRQAVAENPLYFDAISGLATYYIRTKHNQAKAELWACQAVHADPTRGDAWALLARVYSMCGCWTQAIQVAERSEGIDPDNLSPWYAIGEVALEHGEQLEIAATSFRRYLSKPIEGNQPTDEMARTHLAHAESTKAR